MLAKCRAVHLSLLSFVLLSVLVCATSGMVMAKEYKRPASPRTEPIDPCELIEQRGFNLDVDPTMIEGLPCTWNSPAGHFTLHFTGVDNDYVRNESYWFYVLEWDQTAPAVGYLVIGLCDRITRADIIGACPAGYTVGVDLETGVYGIRWTTLPAIPSLHLSFLVKGIFDVGQMEFGVKAGTEASIASICGLYCEGDECELDITCPPDVAVSCEDSTDPQDTGVPTIEGTCPPYQSDHSDSRIPGSCAYEFTIERNWVVTDASGLTRECTQRITVTDDTPPVLTCGENQRLVCNAPVVFDDPVATDNCDPNPAIELRTSSIGPGPGPCDETHARGWVAIDACGNESEPCFQTIIRTVDTEPPVLTCGEDKRIPCNAPVVFDDPVATDNCDPDPVVELRTSSIGPGPNPCEEIHARGWVAVDACGNESEPCFQNIVRVLDTEPPVVTCGPGGRIVCNEPVEYPDPVITDNCDPDPEVRVISTVYPGPGPCEETYEACWEAEDACGNVSEPCCITIVRTLDTEPPVITYCPPSDTFDCSVDVDQLPHAEAQDNCDDDLTVTYTSQVLIGCHHACEINYLRTWVFTDDCLNEARCEQHVTVFDSERPRLCCAPHQVVECDEEVVFTEPTATDNCDADVEVCVTQDWVLPWCGGCQDGDDGGHDGGHDCDGSSVGPEMVDEVMGLVDLDEADVPDALLKCPGHGHHGDHDCVCKYKEVHIRCWKATDDCGLSSQCCQFIFVKACPDDSTGECDDSRSDPSRDILSAPSPDATPTELAVRSHPNPLNGSTTISYALPAEGRVTVAIFDVQGRRVRTLFDGQKTSGSHGVTWDGKDASGDTVESGVYFCRVELGCTSSVLMKLVKM